jgi:hypothetical protein
MGRNEKKAISTAVQEVVSQVEQRRAADDEAKRQAEAERQVIIPESSMGDNPNVRFALLWCVTPGSKP